jgi:hypothetical protein
MRANGRVLLLAALAVFVNLRPGLAEAQVTITSPAPNALLRAGPDFASDVLGDPWDMSNTADIAVDPAQKKGWTNLGFSSGWVGGTLALVNGAANGSHINFLERSYWGIINPGRTGARFPIASGVYTKLAFKMSASGSGASGQSPRVYWFHNDLGDPAGDAVGLRYVNPQEPVPTGNNIFEVDLTTSLLSGLPWTAGDVRGFSIYPNSSAVGYQVQFDWVRLTTGNGHPASAVLPIAWSGGSGANIDVTDGAGTVLRVATGVSSPYSWNYGVLPPGTYSVRVTQGASVSAPVTFRINTPPTLTITDPDASGGEDFATAVLGNPWDMNDANDFRFDNGATIVDHLNSRGVSGGLFNGTSDGWVSGYSQDGIPVGDPQVYLLSGNGEINTPRYRYLTFGLKDDGAFDLLRGSVARVFWGSATGPGAPYNVTVSKDIITWPGWNTYTIDLATLSTAPNGGLENVGAATPWTTNNVRHLRIDPFEFAEVNRGFHIDNVKLAAMDETAGGSFSIRYAAADADGDPVSLSLSYDTDTNAGNGVTSIASGISPASGQYTWNTGSVPPGVYYIYAVVSDGRNAVGAYSTGPVRVTTYTPPSDPLMSLDSPASGATVGQAFQVSGWALDRAATTGTGVDFVHVYAYPNPGSGQAPIFLGAAAYGQSRGDVGAAFGTQFTDTGYALQVNGLAPGPYQLSVYAHSAVSGSYQLTNASLTVVGPLMSLDYPAPDVARAQPFTLSGWSLDAAASSGTGVDTLHVWAYPNPGSGQPALFVGVATYGLSRPDVGAAYGARFTNSGYSLQVKGLAPQVYQFVVFSHSTATGTFNTSRTVTLPVQNAPAMALDAPTAGTVSPSFTVRGWAIDLAAATGTGVNAIHVYAYRNPGSGTPAQFLGVATYGSARGDVAAAFGSSQFTASGYSLPVSGLSAGTYDIVVYARSGVSGAFDNWRVVRITVP